MVTRAVFFDTSFIIALENRHDLHHAKAVSLDRELTKQGCLYLLHEGILLEIGDGYARLDRRKKGIELVTKLTSEEGYDIAPLTVALLAAGLNLYQSRPDKNWGLTDCVSFALMQSLGIVDALTADVHFQQAGFRALLLD